MKTLVLIMMLLMLPMNSALAHHGVASLGMAGLEGPGAPVESSSSATLPDGSWLATLKLDLALFDTYTPARDDEGHGAGRADERIDAGASGVHQRILSSSPGPAAQTHSSDTGPASAGIICPRGPGPRPRAWLWLWLWLWASEPGPAEAQRHRGQVPGPGCGPRGPGPEAEPVEAGG